MDMVMEIFLIRKKIGRKIISVFKRAGTFVPYVYHHTKIKDT